MNPEMYDNDQEQFDSGSAHSNTSFGESEAWEPCLPGEVQGMLNSVRAKRRNKQLAQATTVGVSLILLFAATLWTLPFDQGATGQQVKAFACSDVFDHAEDYVAGKLNALVSGQIEDHLARCPHCKDHVDHLRSEAEANQVIPPVLQNHPAETNRISQQSVTDTSLTIAMKSQLSQAF